MKRVGKIPRVLLLSLLSVVVLFPPFPASATITCSASQSPSWQICGPLQTLTGLNEQPSIIQANDGTLRYVWTHVSLSGANSIFYATRLANGTWTSSSTVTNLGGSNLFPSIVQASNGTIFVFWAYKPTNSPSYSIYSRHLKGSVWSPYSQINPAPTNDNDTLPSASVGPDGTLWLFWTRDNSTAAGTSTVFRQLWYETMSSTGWSKNPQNLTNTDDVNWNFQPSVFVGNDSVPRVVFSRGQSSTGIFQINYIQRTGSGWTVPKAIESSNSTANDMSPSIIQDRNGTFWIFWTRDMNTNFALRGEYSLDNGSTWTGDTLLTAACSGCNDAKEPAAVQSSTDKNIFVLYSTDSAIYTLETVRAISPVHRVVVSQSVGSYGTNASLVYAGGFHNPYGFISQSAVVQLYATVSNIGDFLENASVTMVATNTTNYSLGTQYISLSIGGSAVVIFNWNTTLVHPARYGFSTNASITGETMGNRAGASLTKTNVVHLIPLGDVDQDGSDTLTDVSVIFYNYGFGCSAPGVCSSRYNPWADPSGQGVINIVDVGIVSKNFDILT